MKLHREVESASDDPAIVSVNEAFDRLRVVALCLAAIAMLAVIAGGLWARDILDQQARTRAELAQLRRDQVSWFSALNAAVTSRAPDLGPAFTCGAGLACTGTTNALPKYAGTTLSASAITDDGATITSDLDRTDRQVVVKRPGTAADVTVTREPLRLRPVQPGVFSPPHVFSPPAALTHPAEK